MKLAGALRRRAGGVARSRARVLSGWAETPSALVHSLPKPGHGDAVRRHREQRVVPFSSDVVYGVVADVERYSEFVPYTVTSKIVRRVSRQEFVAELAVGFGALSETYASRVLLDPANKQVRAAAESSRMFNVLTNAWRIRDRPLDKGSCLLEFELEFEFGSSWYNVMADMFFDKVTATMVDAFMTRCKLMEHHYLKQQSPGASHESLPRESRRRKRSEETDNLLGELESLSHFNLGELERIKRNFEANVGPDGDQLLEREAFVGMFHELFGDLQSSGKTSAQDLREGATIIFDALDMNGDGRLNLREFTAGLSTVMHGTPLERCRFWFRCYDVDADGLVNRDELYEMIRSSIEVRNALLRSGLVAPRRKSSLLLKVNTHELVQDAVDRCFRNSFDAERVSLPDVIQMRLF